MVVRRYWDSNCFLTASSRRLNMRLVRSIEITYPTNITDRHRIVAKLDAAFADTAKLTATASKQIENYRALKSAVLARELRSEAA